MRRISEIIQENGRTYFRLEKFQEEKRFLFFIIKKPGWYPVVVDIFKSTYTMGYELNRTYVTSSSKNLIKGKISVIDELNSRAPYNYRGYNFIPALKFTHDNHNFNIVYYCKKIHSSRNGYTLFGGMEDIMKYVDRKLHKDHVIHSEII